MADKTAIIAGLGNPGRQYAGNRHNVGFMVVDALAEHFGTSTGRNKWQAEYEKVRAEDAGGNPMDVILMKPLTFMNGSGQAVCPACRFYKAPADRLLVVHDESEIAFADLRFKKGGGHKGHNGLRDIIAKCGSADFHRLRVGVGRPEHRDLAGYLLADFSSDEQGEMDAYLARAVKMCLEWIGKL